jgi:hypothetical protein
MAKKKSAGNKLFVLDTNVLMHDPSSLFRFEEHDIYLPMVTLEELDNNKKGITEVARNARQTSRNLEEIVGASLAQLDEGCPLSIKGNKHATGRLFLQTDAMDFSLPMLAGSIADNQILGVVIALKKKYPEREGILVSKDINIRIKARALSVLAEDYFNDKVLEDTELLYSGMKELPENFWDKHSKAMESWQDAGRMFYRITGPLCKSFLINEFVFYAFEKPFEISNVTLWESREKITTVTSGTSVGKTRDGTVGFGWSSGIGLAATQGVTRGTFTSGTTEMMKNEFTKLDSGVLRIGKDFTAFIGDQFTRTAKYPEVLLINTSYVYSIGLNVLNAERAWLVQFTGEYESNLASEILNAAYSYGMNGKAPDLTSYRTEFDQEITILMAEIKELVIDLEETREPKLP